jgi:Zn-dependent protease with chaperone function
VTATLPSADPPSAAAEDSRRVPAGTTSLFALLIGTVLATASVVYATVWGLGAAGGIRMQAAEAACHAKELLVHPRTPQEAARLTELSYRVGQCMQPVYLEEASWAAYGTGVLFGLAGVIYWAYPRWVIRRRRLVPIASSDSPELAECLKDLACTARLDPPPKYLLAPYASTFGGLAFGRFGRRYVQLDAGLVTGFTTDRAKFRAVVLHELAHLRNRDVDITYLTMAIWWSFVAVALVPMVAVVVDPGLLSTSPRWQPSSIASWPFDLRFVSAVAVLTGLIYLTRNAILRRREIYADARVGDWPDHALREVVDGLTRPARWRGATGTHPHPCRRLQAIDRPAAVLPPRLWELFAAGVATAVIAVNLRYQASHVFSDHVLAGLAGTGLICVLGLAVPLIVAVWRAAVRLPHVRPPLRAVLPLPGALVLGFLLGERLGWISTQTAWTQFDGTIETLLTSVLVLFAGGVTLAVWTASAAHSAMDAAGSGPQRALPATIVAGTIAFAPWFGGWITFSDTGVLRPAAGSPPLSPISSDWYAALGQQLANLTANSFSYVTNLPLILLGLAALWFVPIVVMGRGVIPGVKGALTAGFAGAAAFTLTCVAITYRLRTGLPAQSRGSDLVLAELENAFIALAVLCQAVVAVVVAATARRHRPALIPLAIAVTGLLATVVMFVGLDSLSDRCGVPYDGGPQSFLPAAALTLQRVLVDGAVVAIPAALLGAAVQALLGRHREPAPEQDSGDQRHITRVTATVLLTLIAVVLAAAVVAAPYDYRLWVR